nr:T9SS type A sorting domain-containing protein [Bacteroidota bacterium]
INLGEHLIFPFQTPTTDDPHGTMQEFVYDRGFYQRTNVYPEKVICTDNPEIWRDVMISGLHITPFKYHPKTRQLEVITNMRIEITFDGFNKQTTVFVPKEVTPMFYNLYEKTILNFESLSLTKTLRATPGIKYLVVTNTEALQAIEPLVSWKNEQGYRTEVRAIEPGFETPQQIKDYVFELYESDGLEYVLMVGDAYPNGGAQGGPNLVPMYYWAPAGEEASYSDSWFTCLNGPDDHFADLAIGRLVYNVGALDELELQIQKTVNYYQNPDQTSNWGENTILIAHQEQYPGKYTQCCEEIRLWPYNVQNPVFTTAYGGEGAVNQDIIDFINHYSCGIFNYRGHGSQTAFSMWGPSGNFTESHVNQLTNNNRLFVVFDVACDNMDIANYHGNCLGESFMKHTAAAVAINGAIMPSFTIPNHDYDKELYSALYNEGIYPIGYSSNFANASLLNGHGWMGRKNVRTYLWLGDPSLEPWTIQPQFAEASYNPQMVTGAESFFVQVTGAEEPVRDAMVCFSATDGSVYEVRYTDAAGTATFDFNEPLQNTGEARLTISKHNYIPYQGLIEILPTAGPYIIRDSLFYCDVSGGNGNGIPDYNETLLLSLAEKNIGISPAANVYVTLSTQDEFVSLLDTGEEYGTINAGQTVLIENAFEFKIAENIEDGHIIVFNVLASSGEDSWESHFICQVFAPLIQLVNIDVSDPSGNNNSRIDPGETVDLFLETANNGHSDAFEVQANLIPTNDLISVNSTVVYLGDLPSGQCHLAGFNISTGLNAQNGTAIPMIYDVEYGGCHSDQMATINIGLLTEDFETGDFSQFDWQFGGQVDWAISNSNAYEGQYCAKSGAVADWYTSALIIVMQVATNDSISFYRKVSSEENHDYLEFFINSNLIESWSGELDWERVSFPLTEGYYLFKWIFKKNGTITVGDDCAWVDNIDLPHEMDPSLAVYSGKDSELCEGHDFITGAFALNYTKLIWETTGTGYFNCDTCLVAAYVPSTEDLLAGYVTLTLTVSNSGGQSISDSLMLSLMMLPGQPGEIVGDTTVCMVAVSVYNIYNIPNASLYTWELTPSESGVMTCADTSITIQWSENWTGLAELKVKGSNGCGDGPFSPIKPIQVEDCTGMEYLSDNNPVWISPNPSMGKFSIRCNALSGPVDVKIYSLFGETVLKQSFTAVGGPLNIVLEKPGMYVVLIEIEDNRFIQKIIVQK